MLIKLLVNGGKTALKKLTVPCAFWQVDLRVEKGVGVSKKTYLVLFFTFLKPANVIITAVSGKCGESSETSAPIARTPFPFLGLRLHNGA